VASQRFGSCYHNAPIADLALYRMDHYTQSFIWNRVSDDCSGGGLFRARGMARGLYETNNPSLGNAFWPRLGSKGRLGLPPQISEKAASDFYFR
jgi:hypothetical protein